MYIITGGAGFIGSAVVRKLNEKGIDNILIVDHLGTSDKWKNFRKSTFKDYLPKERFLELILADKIATDVDAVIHIGACSSTTERDVDYLMHNNYYYTKALCEWSATRGVRFIYASSAATYGDGSAGFSDNHNTVKDLRPLNAYGYSKQVFDQYALQTGLLNRVTGIKFFNVFGPNEYSKGDMASVMFKAYHQIKQTGKLKLFKSYNPKYKDGEQVRDFVYVKDCVEIIWQLLEKPEVVGLLNLGTGKCRTWLDLGNAVFAAMGLKSNIEIIDMPESLRNAYQYYSEAEMSKFRKYFPDFKFHTLEEAITDYVQNYLATQDPYI